MAPSQKDIDACCLRVAAYYGEKLRNLARRHTSTLNRALECCSKRHNFAPIGPTNAELDGCWEIMTLIWEDDGTLKP